MKNIVSTKTTSPALDVAMMKRFYKWGGLVAYRVSYFDPVQFRTVEMPMTFSKVIAIKQLGEKKTRYKFSAVIDNFIIKFDGAFAKVTT